MVVIPAHAGELLAAQKQVVEHRFITAHAGGTSPISAHHSSTRVYLRTAVQKFATEVAG
jgi:hypothetical protein